MGRLCSVGRALSGTGILFCAFASASFRGARSSRGLFASVEALADGGSLRSSSCARNFLASSGTIDDSSAIDFLSCLPGCLTDSCLNLQRAPTTFANDGQLKIQSGCTSIAVDHMGFHSSADCSPSSLRAAAFDRKPHQTLKA